MPSKYLVKKGWKVPKKWCLTFGNGNQHKSRWPDQLDFVIKGPDQLDFGKLVFS
jgi:hypothetical protein